MLLSDLGQFSEGRRDGLGFDYAAVGDFAGGCRSASACASGAVLAGDCQLRPEPCHHAFERGRPAEASRGMSSSADESFTAAGISATGLSLVVDLFFSSCSCANRSSCLSCANFRYQALRRSLSSSHFCLAGGGFGGAEGPSAPFFHSSFSPETMALPRL